MKKEMDLNKRKKLKIITISACAVAAVAIVVAIVIVIRENLPYSDVWLDFKESVGLNEINEDEFISEDEIETAENVTTYTPPATPVNDYENIPVKFYFLERGVECDVYAVGSDNGTMDAVKSAKDASWMSKAPFVAPGDVGNAVIAGHNKWRGEQGAFSLLNKMKKGEKVAVTFDKGFTRYFEVVSIHKNFRYDDKTYMRTDYDEPILTLITCMGDWDNSLGMSIHRVAVICKPTVFKGK